MMDYIIIGLLIIVIILVIVAIMKNVNEGKITERLGNLESNTIKGLSSFQIDIMKTIKNKQLLVGADFAGYPLKEAV